MAFIQHIPLLAGRISGSLLLRNPLVTLPFRQRRHIAVGRSQGRSYTTVRPMFYMGSSTHLQADRNFGQRTYDEKHLASSGSIVDKILEQH